MRTRDMFLGIYTFHYWAIAHPVEGIFFSSTGSVREDDTH